MGKFSGSGKRDKSNPILLMSKASRSCLLASVSSAKRGPERSVIWSTSWAELGGNQKNKKMIEPPTGKTDFLF